MSLRPCTAHLALFALPAVLLLTAAAASQQTEIAAGFEPDWSPDGRRIAYTRTHDRGRDIHLITADGLVDERVTNTADPEFFPRWSPDGTRLSFIRGFGPQARIVVRRLEQGTEREFAMQTVPAMVPPAWSPAADRIVFTGRIAADATPNERPDMDLLVVSLADGSVARLTANPADDWDPAWSPDGQSIVFVSDRGGDADLYAMPAAGGDATLLHRGAGSDVAPGWSPDGRWIVFTSTRTKPTQVLRVRADSGVPAAEPEALTADEGRKSYPSISPDGTMLLYVVVGEGRGAEDRILRRRLNSR